jgi:glutaminase
VDPVVPDEAPYVSTGELPSPELVRRSVDEAYERIRTENGGEPSAVYPALARVSPHLFGICAAGTHGGGRHAAGDAEHPFTIMSVAKRFVFAAICQALDLDTSAAATNYGNSVRGQLAARLLSRRLGLTLFASEPAP